MPTAGDLYDGSSNLSSYQTDFGIMLFFAFTPTDRNQHRDEQLKGSVVGFSLS